MLNHPETHYRLAEQRLGDYRRQGAGERLARSIQPRPVAWAAALGAWLADLLRQLIWLPRPTLPEAKLPEGRLPEARLAEHSPVDLR